MNLNKGTLVDAVVESVDYSKKEVAAVIDALIETITEAVSKGDKVTLFGFGTFESVKREARTCKNPQTGANITVPARNVPKFKASKNFKELVNN